MFGARAVAEGPTLVGGRSHNLDGGAVTRGHQTDRDLLQACTELGELSAPPVFAGTFVASGPRPLHKRVDDVPTCLDRRVRYCIGMQ